MKAKLSQLDFFKRKYYDKDIHGALDYGFYPDNVGMVRQIRSVNDITDLNLGCKVPQSVPFLPIGGYLMFALDFSMGCKPETKTQIIDNVFGTDIMFNVSLYAFKADGSPHYRISSFGILRGMSENCEEFLYIPSCSKHAIFVSSKITKRENLYKWKHSRNQITTLSGLIALDPNKAAVKAIDASKISSGTYRIVSAGNSKICLEYDGEGLVSSLIDPTSEAQKFVVQNSGGADFSISPVAAKGAVLTINKGSKKYKTAVTPAPNNKTPDQTWNFIGAINEGVYYIVNRRGKCLDICNGKAVEGCEVGLYGNSGAANQKWRLSKN